MLEAIGVLALWAIVLGAALAVLGLGVVGRHGGGVVQGVDDGVARWFLHHRSTLVGGSRVIALVGDAPALALVAVVIAVILFRAGLRVRAFIPVVAYLGAEFFVYLTRAYIHRPRPGSANFPGPGALPGIHETSWSFPSGHATAGSAVVISLAGVMALSRKARWPWIVGAVLAGLVASSRLVLGVHWLSDATVGLLVGTTWGVVVTLVLADVPWPFRTWGVGSQPSGAGDRSTLPVQPGSG